MSYEYMESPQGLWIYNKEETDLQKAFSFIGDRPAIKDTLRILLIGDSGFTASNGQQYLIKDNPNLFFIDYIPRIYNFVAKVHEVNSFDDIQRKDIVG